MNFESVVEEISCYLLIFIQKLGIPPLVDIEEIKQYLLDIA